MKLYRLYRKFLFIPPQISISKMVMYLKGKTARKTLQEFPKLNKSFEAKI